MTDDEFVDVLMGELQELLGDSAMFGSQRRQEFEDAHGTVRRANELMREKPLIEIQLQTAKWRKPMTLAELHAAVRELVTPNVTTFIELSIKKYSHRFREEPLVEVSIWASISDGSSVHTDAPTAEEALREFSSKGLRELGLTELPPALERLAAMDASTEQLQESK